MVDNNYSPSFCLTDFIHESRYKRIHNRLSNKLEGHLETKVHFVLILVSSIDRFHYFPFTRSSFISISVENHHCYCLSLHRSFSFTMHVVMWLQICVNYTLFIRALSHIQLYTQNNNYHFHVYMQ